MHRVGRTTGPPGDCVPDWTTSRHQPSSESPLGGCGVVPTLYRIVRFLGSTSTYCPLNVSERNLWGQNDPFESVIRGAIYPTQRKKELGKWQLQLAACFPTLPTSASQSFAVNVLWVATPCSLIDMWRRFSVDFCVSRHSLLPCVGKFLPEHVASPVE
jgi:hypothetical protein